MIEVGHSKSVDLICYSHPEEAENSIMEINGRMLGTKPFYVAPAKCKLKHPAHFTHHHIHRLARASAVPNTHIKHIQT